MADLIIKPNAATGDKLILQDRAGGAVLTTADSGATIANATLNSPTMVTPALGTPASGVVTNLSGVLPVGVTGGSGLDAVPASVSDGDIVQTVLFQKTGEESAYYSSTTFGKIVDTGGNADWRITISNVAAGNDVIVSAVFSARQKIVTNSGMGFGFLRDTGSTPSNSGGTAVWYASERHVLYSANAVNPMYLPWHLMFVDTAMSAGTYIYYVGASATDGNNTIAIRSNTGWPFQMIAQEIKR